MSLLLLIVFICISYLIVMIGAIALEMTGMEKAVARFQALSAFSGTGFTTREAERIVGHPRRRRIVMYLIILGNAGIVSVIATFVLSLRGAGTFRFSLNMLLIGIAIFVLYRFVTHREIARKMTAKTKEVLVEKFHFDKVQIEEVLQQADGYGVARVLVGPETRIAGITLAQSGLKKAGLMVLSIEREKEVLNTPSGEAEIRPGDRLVCYGKLSSLKEFI